jgi:hypothetical protein
MAERTMAGAPRSRGRSRARRSLDHDRELDAAVASATRGRPVADERLVATRAAPAEALLVDAAADELGDDLAGTFIGDPFVRVAEEAGRVGRDLEADVGVAGEHPCDAIEDRPGTAKEDRAVELELDALESDR